MPIDGKVLNRGKAVRFALPAKTEVAIVAIDAPNTVSITNRSQAFHVLLARQTTPSLTDPYTVILPAGKTMRFYNDHEYSMTFHLFADATVEIQAVSDTMKEADGAIEAHNADPEAHPQKAEVHEYAGVLAFPSTGTTGHIYIDTDTDTPYRWDGSEYHPLGTPLGETSTTAYRGDRGKTAYDHSQITAGNPHNPTLAQMGAQFLKDVLAAAMPVGYIYISVTATNPATLFGFGTWVAFATGRTLVGIDPGDTDLNAAEKTYGAKTVALVLGELAAHAHTMNAHTHSIDHDHGAVTSGNQSVDHSHYLSIQSGQENTGHFHGFSTGYVSNDHSHSIGFSTGGQSANHDHIVINLDTGAIMGTQGGAASGSSSFTQATTTRGTTFGTQGARQDHSHWVGGGTGGISANHTHSGTTNDIDRIHVHTTSGNTNGMSVSHTHSVDLPNLTGTSGSTTATMANAGSGTAHNNMQPSIVVYMFKRTA